MNIFDYPEKGTVLYFFNPVNLFASTYQYTVEKYFNLDYFNRRIDAGLCYSDLDSVLERISYEQESVAMRHNK